MREKANKKCKDSHIIKVEDKEKANRWKEIQANLRQRPQKDNHEWLKAHYPSIQNWILHRLIFLEMGLNQYKTMRKIFIQFQRVRLLAVIFGANQDNTN